MAIYKDPFTNRSFTKIGDLEEYVEKYHKDKIPSSYNGDVARFLYDLRCPRRKCQICGAKTPWNKKLKKYDVLCGVPSNGEPWWEITKAYFNKVLSFFRNKGNTCDAMMRKQYLKNIKRVRGTDNLMADPEYQKMLLESKSIASTEKFRGLEYTVIGSYEKEFVRVLDKSDLDIHLQMPGPTIHVNDHGVTYTITDAYIPEYNLIISIKDEGRNVNNYKEHYLKSCIVFWYVNNKTSYKIIELNGIKEVKQADKIIKAYMEGDIKVHDAAPCFMKKYTPELYNDLKEKR